LEAIIHACRRSLAANVRENTGWSRP
jgi:hypothetical protein